MLAILQSAVAGALRFIVTGGGVKMILAVVFGWLMTAVIALILPLIPGTQFITDFGNNVGDGIMWWVFKFRIPQGLAIVFGGGYAVRFLIRRIPVIG